jgi:phosphatidylserine decarboxylase
MKIPVVKEVIPFLVGVLLLFGGGGAVFWHAGCPATALVFAALAVIFSGYMLYFFRDPARQPPIDPTTALAGADGVIAGIKEVQEGTFLKTDAIRVSIFLSLFDVHVNRAPVAGTVKFCQYYPGKRYFTFEEKSSDFNQHSSILIEGPATRCLVHQIVGPVARRVVYWLAVGQELQQGERIGMMKFGSRLDMYFPKNDVEIVVKPGDRVQAGLTVVAKIKNR